MSQKLKGNTKGLKTSQIKSLERLFRRSIDPQEIVSLELARELSKIAQELRRRVGVLVTREGHIEEVCIGTHDILYLPDLGRYRLGRGRLRRLKLIFTDLSKHEGQAHIPNDIYTDLEKLRLDMVISLKQAGKAVCMSYAYLRPSGNAEGESVHTERVRELARITLDYSSFMSELEDELSQGREAAQAIATNKALLIGVYDKKSLDFESSMAELRELARTAGVDVADIVIQRRDIDPRTLLGKGKLEEVVLTSLRQGAEMLIFDGELKPGQWRSITNSTELKILDRSMLILDIFAQRATSSEGRLQVELAQLKYNLPRLTEEDTGLSRLSGGIGGRGPGETKLEIGRRRIRDRIVDLEARIEALGQQRELRRRPQRESGVALVAILGYTNVGKSTLFNALTQSKVLVENKLFATLDPAKRRFEIAHVTGDAREILPIVLSDTVGFIRNLPEELKNAFRATLEELAEAKLLLHVIDASDQEVQTRIEAVTKILEELKVQNLPQIIVANKIDLVSASRKEQLIDEYGAILVSATKREGFKALSQAIANKLILNAA